MNTGWDSLEVPAAGGDDPVSGFGPPGAEAQDAVFRQSQSDHHTFDAQAEGSGEHYDEHEQSHGLDAEVRKKSKAGIYIIYAVMGAVVLGGIYLVVQPLMAAFGSGPSMASTSTRKPPALALDAVKGEAAAKERRAEVSPNPAAEGATSANVVAQATASAPAVPTSSASSPTAGPTMTAVGGKADAVPAPRPESQESGTASAVAAVLANASVKAADVAPKSAASSASLPPRGSSAQQVATANPAAKAIHEPQQPAASRHKGATAVHAHHAPAVTGNRGTRSVTGSAVAHASGKAGKSNAKSSDTSAMEQVVGYSLLAINPRTGDFQQAWVRDAAGKLRIVSAGDRIGSLQVLRVDGDKGEVLTAAGVIR